jgi:hypothetical protein
MIVLRHPLSEHASKVFNVGQLRRTRARQKAQEYDLSNGSSYYLTVKSQGASKKTTPRNGSAIATRRPMSPVNVLLQKAWRC